MLIPISILFFGPYEHEELPLVAVDSGLHLNVSLAVDKSLHLVLVDEEALLLNDLWEVILAQLGVALILSEDVHFIYDYKL